MQIILNFIYGNSSEHRYRREGGKRYLVSGDDLTL